MAFRLTLILFLLTSLAASSAAQTVKTHYNRRNPELVILELGRRISESLAESFAEKLEVIDSDLAKAAAQGAGYAPSLNMAVSEARTFGAAVGSDFFVLVDAQTPSAFAVDRRNLFRLLCFDISREFPNRPAVEISRHQGAGSNSGSSRKTSAQDNVGQQDGRPFDPGCSQG